MASCYGCEKLILDEYIIKVAPDMEWHSTCLRCSVCDSNLSDSPSCYMKNGKPYCKTDYDKEFIVKCHGCRNVIEKSALVMTAKNFYYHVNCFVCANCSDTLVTGDQFSVSAGGNLYCHSDACIQELTASSDDGWSDGNSSVSCGTYKETANSIDLENSPLSSNPDKEKHEVVTLDGKSRQASSMKKPCKDKPTRVRTVLNEKQLSTLKRCYAANPRPDSVMKEQLVDLTGLSPRVIRVWFQNKRCKDKKKMMLNGGGDGKIGDILQNRLPVHSSPLNEEISLPGCSPPVRSTMHTLQSSTMSTHVGSFGASSAQDLRLLVSNQDYREAASYPNYGMWNKYGNFDCSYHQENNIQSSHYQQLVS